MWTPELRKRKKLVESKEKRPAWTEEKRKAAAERIIARNLKARDTEERMKRRRMTRYVVNKLNGEIFVYTERLAQNPNMLDLGVIYQKEVSGNSPHYMMIVDMRLLTSLQLLVLASRITFVRIYNYLLVSIGRFTHSYPHVAFAADSCRGIWLAHIS